MTPSEYQQMRKSIGLSQAKAAEYLNVTERTIQRRETNGTDNMKVTREAQLAMCSLHAYFCFYKIFKDDRETK